jgi:hypothetical protein
VAYDSVLDPPLTFVIADAQPDLLGVDAGFPVTASIQAASGSSLTTGSFSPGGPDRLLVAFLLVDAAGATGQPSVSGGGLTWTRQQRVTSSGNTSAELWTAWSSTATPLSVNAVLGSTVSGSAVLAVYSVAGASPTVGDSSGADYQLGGTVNITVTAAGIGNLLLGAFKHGADESGLPAMVNTHWDYTLIVPASDGNFAVGRYDALTPGAGDVTFGSTAYKSWGAAVGIEIRAASYTPVPTPATAVGVVPSAPSPHLSGTSVTFSATGSGSTTAGSPTPAATYQYRFWLFCDETWHLVQDYGVGSNWTLPASTPPGSYTVSIDARTRTNVDSDVQATLTYDIIDSGVPSELQVDGGFPVAATIQATTGGSLTTQSFSPGGSERLLVAILLIDAANDDGEPTISGGGLTWTRRQRVTSDSGGTYAELWTAWSPGGHSMAVSATLGSIISGSAVLAVYSVAGASPIVGDASGAAYTGGGPVNVTVTASGPGNLLVGGFKHGADETGLPPMANTTWDYTLIVPASDGNFAVGRLDGFTTGTGDVTFGSTANKGWGGAVGIEIKANGED